jgi:DNA-binding NtrC family response regulator
MAGKSQPIDKVPRILVVEDDAASRRLYTVILRDAGELTTVRSVEEARTALTESPFDVVVTDLGLPQLAFAFIEELTAAGILTVVVTGYVDDVTLDRVRGLGIYAVLTKPFRAERLRTEVSEAINLRSAADDVGPQPDTQP